MNASIRATIAVFLTSFAGVVLGDPQGTFRCPVDVEPARGGSIRSQIAARDVPASMAARSLLIALTFLEQHRPERLVRKVGQEMDYDEFEASEFLEVLLARRTHAQREIQDERRRLLCPPDSMPDDRLLQQMNVADDLSDDVYAKHYVLLMSELRDSEEHRRFGAWLDKEKCRHPYFKTDWEIAWADNVDGTRKSLRMQCADTMVD